MAVPEGKSTLTPFSAEQGAADNADTQLLLAHGLTEFVDRSDRNSF